MGQPTRENKAIADNNHYHFATPEDEILEKNIPGSGATSERHVTSNKQAIICGERTGKRPGRGYGRRQWAGNEKVSMRQTAGLEHRHENRYKTLVYVDIRYRDEVTIPGVLYNISNNGMFVLCNKVTNIRHTVDIHLPIPHRDRLLVTIPGFVIHRNHYGFGLMFRELDQAGEAVVKKLLTGVNVNA